MLITYIRWKDACAVERGAEVPQVELAELEEVGFLLDINDEGVCIGMEYIPPESPLEAGRWSLNIPRGNILEMKTIELDRAFNRKAKTLINRST